MLLLYLRLKYPQPKQWRIQDFPEGGANSQSGCVSHFLPKTAWKWKNLDWGGFPGVPLDPLMQRIKLPPVSPSSPVSPSEHISFWSSIISSMVFPLPPVMTSMVSLVASVQFVQWTSHQPEIDLTFQTRLSVFQILVATRPKDGLPCLFTLC